MGLGLGRGQACCMCAPSARANWLRVGVIAPRPAMGRRGPSALVGLWVRVRVKAS